MELECYLCKRKGENDWDSYVSEDPNELRFQMRNLEGILFQLIREDTTIDQYIENKRNMCPFCQDIMAGIESEADKDELENRLNERIEELQEREETILLGFH